MYQSKSRGWSQHLDFMGWDVFALEVGLIITLLVHIGWENMLSRSVFWGLFILLPFVDLTLMVGIDAYHGVIRRNTFQELSELLKQGVYLSLVFGTFLILFQANGVDTRYIFLNTMLIYLLLCFTIRQIWKDYLQRRLHIKNRTGLLVVADVDRIREVVTNLINHNYNSYRFVGVALLDQNTIPEDGYKALQNIMHGEQEVTGLEIVATREDLISYLVKNWVDEVYLDIPHNQDMPTDLINQIMGMGITVHMAITSIDQIEARHKGIDWICGQATITASLGYVSGRDLFLKRMIDIIGGLIGTVATVLITLVLGPMIYFSSPGPIFFSQTRIGENGRKFKMYKFRSMYMDAEKRKQELLSKMGVENDLMFKMEHDPRIIGMKQMPDGKWKKGIGGWIRDLSLDEFPQFLNVLKGDMSLVGTRPPTVDEWEQYQPSHRARMSTKPGLTGLWQVSGRSKIRDFDQVVQLDREYIENWSLKLDWQILVRTIWVVVTRSGAM